MLNPLWKYSAAGLLFMSLLLGMALHLERRAKAREVAKVATLTAELKRISTERNEQAARTGKAIERVRIVYRDAERQAERIERAPLPGQCKTPDAVMGAEL